MTTSTCVLHMGHFFSRNTSVVDSEPSTGIFVIAQARQVARWPQGTKSIVGFASRQQTHSSVFFALAEANVFVSLDTSTTSFAAEMFGTKKSAIPDRDRKAQCYHVFGQEYETPSASTQLRESACCNAPRSMVQLRACFCKNCNSSCSF